MSNKNPAENAQGAKPAQSKKTEVTPINPIQKRLEAYASLEKMVKQRKNLQIHFDKLEELEITTPLNEFEESENQNIERISLSVGHQAYNINNPTLIKMVAEFLKTTLTARMATLEAEILEATI